MSPTTGRRAVLHIADSPGDAWSAVIRRWFEEVIRIAWKQPRPSLVLVPTRSHAQALKARLLESEQSHLGLLFATPSSLRGLIARDAGRQLFAREHFRLLLAVSGEEILRHHAEPDRDEEPNADIQAAKAVVRAPDHLLRTLDRLEMAGWNFEHLQLQSFQPIVRRFREHLRACGFDLPAQIDRDALARSDQDSPLFAKALITGFDGAHWQHWFLLRTAVAAAEDATVVLEYPQGDLSNADACWIGSWEEALGEAAPVSPPTAATTDSLFSEEEMRGVQRPAADCTFLVGVNNSEEAKAVALQCLRFLGEKSCTRVGIVFACAGSLPRLTASALSKLEVPHNDGIAHSVPGLFESADWRAWLQLQQSPRISSLLHFVNALPQRDEIFPALSAQRFERTLRSAYSEVLIDDLEILQRFLAQEAGQTKQSAAEALASLDFLPPRASLANFLHETEAAFGKLGWKQHWMEVSRRVLDWSGKLQAEFSRTLYLRWLGEIASTSTSARDATGDHPYARVQLLTVPQAQGQEWSHLIFAGWNEGAWPPPEIGEFAAEDEIAGFNRSIQNLNRRAAHSGGQGEGHTSIRPNHSLYLGPFEQRQIAQRQFQTLLESAREGVAMSASLVQESASDRLWNPSELFTRLYRETHRQALTQAALKHLQRATREFAGRFCETPWRLTQTPYKPDSRGDSVMQTRTAYDARRDSTQPSGEYDFSLRTPAARVPILSVSEVESLVKSPALVWLKKYLGVEGADDESNPWSAATGQWVHRWLASVAEGTSSRSSMDVQNKVPLTFTRLSSASGIDERIRAAADEKAAEIKRLCEAAGKTIPDWWNSGWQNAFCLARNLGAKLATIEGWPWIATEWKIDGEEPIRVAEDATLVFRGRIDLLLAKREASSLAADELWILDYKTGASKKPLVPAKENVEKRKSGLRKKMLEGTALQLGLYALAARHLGAGEVLLSLIAPAIKPITPQLSISDIEGEAEVFQELARMQKTGIFGMYGLLRSAWSFNRAYPLATLAIDTDLLEDRWELTHPALAKEEEEFYW